MEFVGGSDLGHCKLFLMEGSLGAAPGAIRRSSSDGGYKGRLTVPAGLGIAAAGAARVLLVQYLVLIAFFAFVDCAVGIMSAETSHQAHSGQMQVDVKFQGSQRQQLHLQAQEDTGDVLEHRKVNVVQHSSRGKTVMTIQGSNGRQLSSRSSSYESLGRRESGAGSSILVELVHRDAPNSPFRKLPGSLFTTSREDLHREMLRRDTARVQTLMTRVAAGSSSTSWNSTITRGTKSANGSSSTLQSSVRSGINAGSFEYSMTIHVTRLFSLRFSQKQSR